MTDLGRLRRVLRGPDGRPDGWDEARERAFVDRVLARTTRGVETRGLAPGWRGDLRLVARFVALRLRESRALRVAAAASVLLHVAAVPVLAWWLAPERERPLPRIVFQPPLPPPVEEVVEPERPLDVPSGWELLDAAEDVAPDAATPGAENARRRARFVLSTWLPAEAGPPLETGGPRARDASAWWAELRLLAGEPERRAALASGAWRATRGLDRILAADLLLDAYVLGKAPAGEWTRLLRDLALDVAPRLDGERAFEAEDLLRSWTVRRARAYGLLGGATPDADGHPFPPGWADALERALERRDALDPGLSEAIEGLRRRSESRP